MELPENRFNHTKERLKERYKLDLTKEEYSQLCKQVENSFVSSPYSKNRDSRITVFKGKVITVGYNKQKKLINTVLYNNKRQLRYYKMYKQIFR